MVKSALPDVDVTIQDGGLGLTGYSATGVHVKIGSCTAADPGQFFYLNKPVQVKEKLGAGPLANACLDSLPVQSIIAVVAAASVAGSIGDIDHVGTGTATFAATGSPNNEYEIVIEIVKGGGLNEAQYVLSIDGGDNWLPPKTVPVNGAIIITGTGVTITFTAGEPAASSFVENDTYSFSTTAPAMSNADFLAALEIVKDQKFNYEFIHVVGESSAALWAVCATEADTLEQEHVPTFFVLEARNIAPGETVDQYVQALITERASLASTRVAVVAGRLDVTSLDGLIRDTNGGGVYNGILSRSRVHESPGKVMSYRVSNAVGLKPKGLNDGHIKALDEVGYVTFRTYVGMPGIYVTNGRMMAPPGSDYEFVETRRVADKATRLTRQAALFYVQSEGDEDGIANLQGHMEAPLDGMKAPGVKEIMDYELIIDPEQDIITSKTLDVDLAIFPIPIMRWINIKLRMANPFRR
jgi:hypothetical protein